MKAKYIKTLPNEFDFKSNINPFGIIYHGVKEKHRYRVTCDSGGIWYFTKEEFHRKLLNDDYIICQ